MYSLDTYTTYDFIKMWFNLFEGWAWNNLCPLNYFYLDCSHSGTVHYLCLVKDIGIYIVMLSICLLVVSVKDGLYLVDLKTVKWGYTSQHHGGFKVCHINHSNSQKYENWWGQMGKFILILVWWIIFPGLWILKAIPGFRGGEERPLPREGSSLGTASLLTLRSALVAYSVFADGGFA